MRQADDIVTHSELQAVIEAINRALREIRERLDRLEEKRNL